MGTTGSKLMKGPKPSKTGLNAKVDYVRNQLVGSGITRDEAIQKLLKKFPGTSPSYARSIVYSRCAGLDFTPVRNRAPRLEEKPKATPKKKAAVAQPKAMPEPEVAPKVTRHPAPKTRKKPKFSRPVSSGPTSGEPVVFDP